MNKSTTASLLLIVLLLFAGQVGAVVPTPPATQITSQLLSPASAESVVYSDQFPPHVPGVVLIGLRAGAPPGTNAQDLQFSQPALSATLAAIGVQAMEPLFPHAQPSLHAAPTGGTVDLAQIYRLRLPPGVDLFQAIQILGADPAIAYAEPDYVAYTVATPNDPRYSEQWGLPQISAPAAWDITTGSSSVTIAVVDAGLDTSHPDLAGQLWTNPGEIAGNGLDDDNNGYVDDIHGWNLLDDNADLSDNTGHGTQVAGIIAAKTNNSQGIAGVCWNCRLMTVKVTQPGGVTNYSDIATGVAYAAQKGADVINLSLGGYSDSSTLRAAIASASETAVIVGGAGNDNKSDRFYPAAYDDDVLAVAGTTDTDARVGASNHGSWVDVSAPGEDITTSFDGGGYGSTSGTSMAAPFVSGLAALLKSQHPGWSPDMVRAQIIQTADDIDGLNPGYEGQLGSGRIDAAQALTTNARPLLVYQSYAVDGADGGRPDPGSTVNLDMILYNDWADASNVQATLTSADPYVTVVNETASYGSITALEAETNTTSFRFGISASAPYNHDMSFTLNVTADGGYSTNVALAVSTASQVHNVGGTLPADETWREDQIHVVTGNLLVPSGIALTVEAGSQVRFDTDRYIQVEGALYAVGTPDKEDSVHIERELASHRRLGRNQV